MAKVSIVGDALVVTSSLKFEELENVAKFRPQAMKVVKEENGIKEDVFCIAVNRSASGGITPYGITFNRESRDDEKFAQFTMDISHIDGDVKAWVADNFGASLTMLKEMEVALPEVLTEIAAARQAVMDDIEVVQ